MRFCFVLAGYELFMTDKALEDSDLKLLDPGEYYIGLQQLDRVDMSQGLNSPTCCLKSLISLSVHIRIVEGPSYQLLPHDSGRGLLIPPVRD